MITHTVKQGETLQTIAAQYGITLQQLIAANALPNPDYIRVGDKLIIPQSGE
ncbi:MAG: LysM peptidoglycan-binding domain-containing protein [Ardenticatenaceae bacterium]|nr:LysM peptidoglycan-binding domain-containing protein [Ardenticatenaceae bacterium]